MYYTAPLAALFSLDTAKRQCTLDNLSGLGLHTENNLYFFTLTRLASWIDWEPVENKLDVQSKSSDVKCKKFSRKLELNGSLLE